MTPDTPNTGNNYLTSLAADIEAAHEAVGVNSRAMAEHALKAGRLLNEVKDSLHHGEFGPWLREHVTISERTARRYMTLAKSGVKTDTVADLGIAGTLKAISAPLPPMPDVGQIVVGHDDNGRLLYLWPYKSLSFYFVIIDTIDGNIYGSWRHINKNNAEFFMRRILLDEFDCLSGSYRILDGKEAREALKESEEYRQHLRPDWLLGSAA